VLVLGARLGLPFGLLCWLTFPGLGVRPVAFAVVGMAAFFTGVVRALVTSIVLVIEMTPGFPMLMPMLAACFTAMLVPTLPGDPPVYDALRGR
jgi:CIC family chloride channel protein